MRSHKISNRNSNFGSMSSLNPFEETEETAPVLPDPFHPPIIPASSPDGDFDMIARRHTVENLTASLILTQDHTDRSGALPLPRLSMSAINHQPPSPPNSRMAHSAIDPRSLSPVRDSSEHVIDLKAHAMEFVQARLASNTPRKPSFVIVCEHFDCLLLSFLL